MWRPDELRPLPRECYDAAIRSDSTQVLARQDWPPHVSKMEANEEVAQVWSWVPTPGEPVIEVIRTSIREGSTFWKRDRWYLVETTDGNTWITRLPDKTIEDDGHHTDTLPPWPMR